jgi:hypothetical protein
LYVGLLQKSGKNKQAADLESLFAATRVTRFFFGAIYQNEENYTKLPQNITNDHKIYQMAVK